MNRILLAFICAYLTSASQLLEAADTIVLRFHREPLCSSNTVRLGDLIDIPQGAHLLDPNILNMPLSPAPREGQLQSWSQQDVLEHLTLRGARREILKWSGETKVQLKRQVASDPTLRATAMYPSFIQDRSVKQAETNVALALNDYVALQAGDRLNRQITVQVPVEHVPRLQSRRNIVAIGGGQAPFEGKQEFIVEIADQRQTYRATVHAQVMPPTMVVVAARSLRQGEIVDARALTYAPIPDRQASEQADMFQDIEQVVGQQLRRSIATGVPLTRKAIGPQIVIVRGDLLEIESIAGPVTVRTSGRALADGAIGESILVENVSTRKKLMAIVEDQRRVRIVAAAKGSEIDLTNVRGPEPTSQISPPRGFK